MARPDRLGLVATCFPRTAGDYAGSFVEERARLHLRAGAEVEVVCAGEDSRHEERDGLSIARLACPLFYRQGAGAPELLLASEGDVPPALRWSWALGFSLALARRIARRAPTWTAIESHFLVPCGLAVALAAPHLAHTAWAHSGDVALLERLPVGMGRRIARRLVAAGVDLVFVSADLQTRFGRLAGGACGRVARLPVDASLFRPADAEERARLRARLGLRRFTVFAAGRLVPVKGFDLLIRAVAALAQRDAVELAIAGEGPEAARLRTLASAHGVSLRLLGAIARSDVAAWMRAADVYAQPSRVLRDGRTEGSPMACAEAAACGIPILASAVGGLRERGEAATLLPADDVPAWAAALRRLTQQRAQLVVVDRKGEGDQVLDRVGAGFVGDDPAGAHQIAG